MYWNIDSCLLHIFIPIAPMQKQLRKIPAVIKFSFP